MDVGWLANLRADDTDAWRRFFVEYYHVLRCALGIGLWRLGHRATLSEQRELLVTSMRRCREALRGAADGGRGDEDPGEGRFRAYLFHLVTASSREACEMVSPPAPRSAPRWQDEDASPDPGDVSRLRAALAGLSPPARSIVVLYHLEPDAPSLREIAQVLGWDHEAVRSSYQRGLSSLSSAVSRDGGSAVARETIEKWLAHPSVSTPQSDSPARGPSLERIWGLATSEITAEEHSELARQIAASPHALRELAVAYYLLDDPETLEPRSARLEVAEEALRGAGFPAGIQRFHWFALAIAAVIGVFMFFDAGHPVRVSVVGYEVLSAGSEPESTRDCEFRLEFSSAYERNVVLLLVHARGGEGLVTRLFPAPLQAGREQASPSGVSTW